MSDFEFNVSGGDVRLYPGALKGQLTGTEGAIGRHMRKIGRRIVAAAKVQVGVESGELRSSIHMTHGSNAAGQFLLIGSNLSHAYMHHQGTRPHMIRPKAHKFMRFSAGGRVIYSKEVMHPGTRPNHYLSDQLYLVRL